MREVFLMAALVAAVMFSLGYLTQKDIQRCMALGNTYEVCNHTFNR